jgi:hypothetical protein
MADLSDVSNALGQLCEDALYPVKPPVGASIAAIPVLIQIGWPDPKSLDKMVSDAEAVSPSIHAQVTVYPRSTEKNMTRYPREWQAGPKQPKTFTLTQAGQVVAVGGAQPSIYYRQNLAIFISGKVYIFSTQAGDTPASIATGLAALIAVDLPSVTVSGTAITLPNAAHIGALRIGTGSPVAMEVKRQEREFQLTVWAPTLAARDAIAKPIDVAVAVNQWLTFADGTSGRLLYKGSPYTDFDQKQGIYRRDLVVGVEYATEAADFAPEVIAVQTSDFINSTLDVLGTEGLVGLVTESQGQIHIVDPDLTRYT